MNALTLPGCGQPATIRIEGYTHADGNVSLDASAYACDIHIDVTMAALAMVGLAGYRAPLVVGTKRCGDGMDFTGPVSVILTAPVVPIRAVDASAEIAAAAARLLSGMDPGAESTPEAEHDAAQVADFLRELIEPPVDLDAVMTLAMEVGEAEGRRTATRDALAHVSVLAGRVRAEAASGGDVLEALALLADPARLTAHRTAMLNRNRGSEPAPGFPAFLEPRHVASTLTVVEMATLTSLTPWEVFLAGARLRTRADAVAVAESTPIGTSAEVADWVERVARMSPQAVVAALDWTVDEDGARRVIDLCVGLAAERDGGQ
ncbi:hypothetical protein ACIBF5_15885 [Micromonospora sp. NPDC050417]|uniref:hypothetical protein n=1 Tax=Micromonospora sp. NPDC050417 TaxID=3364280 RepID=UPI0037B6E80D